MPVSEGAPPPGSVQSAVRAFVLRFTGAQPDQVIVEARTVAGGLESDAVLDVCVHFRRGRDRCFRFIAKVVRGNAVRESSVYLALAASPARSVSPRLYEASQLDDGRHILYIQRVRPARLWPWREVDAAGSILDSLVLVHQSLGTRTPGSLDDWDYEQELVAHSTQAIELLERTRREPSLAVLARRLPPVKRIVSSLTALRRQLLAAGPSGTAIVHGDVHPGNAMLRRTRARFSPVLIDWARARSSSPLEDVHSWLHSLGFWEPEAHRRHDTLVARYLAAGGGSGRFDSNMRGAYWLAGASNALSGALVYHLAVLLSSQHADQARAQAFRASESWLRVLRRADAYWS